MIASSYIRSPLRSSVLLMLRTMMTCIVSFGRFLLVYVLVMRVTLTEYQNIDNTLMK